jgi:hypothetical protein
MAATAYRTASVADSSDTVISFDSGYTTIVVAVPATSSYGVLVNIPALHPAGKYFPVPAGSSQAFRNKNCMIAAALLQGDGGTATDVVCGPVSKTSPG